MEYSDLYLITQIFIAIGTVLIAILAIWGEKIRNWIAGPRLMLKIHNVRGDITTRQDNKKSIYYHVKIENKRQWAQAKHVRILCTAISKKAPDGSFIQEPLIVPVQLTWAFPSFHELLPNITTEDFCDLGYLDENAEKFILSLYIYPNNFRGFILANEAMRVHLIAAADNFASKSPYILEIYWDGKGFQDLEEMGKHLIIKEVKDKIRDR